MVPAKIPRTGGVEGSRRRVTGPAELGVRMRLTITRRALCVSSVLLLAFAFGPAVGVQAAKPDRPAVQITSPAAGSTGTGRNLVISGTAARGATTVSVTIGDDPNNY